MPSAANLEGTDIKKLEFVGEEIIESSKPNDNDKGTEGSKKLMILKT